jgi:hypothetical protein
MSEIACAGTNCYSHACTLHAQPACPLPVCMPSVHAQGPVCMPSLHAHSQCGCLVCMPIPSVHAQGPVQWTCKNR